jgi:hypothetical protein
MFRIDNGNKTPWPQKMGLKIEGLELAEKHLVVVYSGGKPIQSFRFRFTDYKETELCLLFEASEQVVQLQVSALRFTSTKR